MEYINKQQILEKAKKHQNNPFGASLIIAEIEKADDDLVRCKDCKHWERTVFDPLFNRYIGECHCKQWENEYFYYETYENNFCSYGKRETDEQ